MFFYDSPFKLELIGRILEKDGTPLPYSTREVSKLSEVLMDPKKAVPNGIAYYMFRGVYAHDPLVYDITVIPSRMFGEEYVKTYGHHHTEAKEGLTYPEVYQILHGEAVFVMQTSNRDGSMNCILTKCKTGDIVFIPPNYGHVMINPGSSTLVSANIVSTSFVSDYSEYKENHGAAYYYTTDGFVQNLNCIVRKTQHLSPKELLETSHLSIGDLLKEITQNPEKLGFLEDPTLLKSD